MVLGIIYIYTRIGLYIIILYIYIHNDSAETSLVRRPTERQWMAAHIIIYIIYGPIYVMITSGGDDDDDNENTGMARELTEKKIVYIYI